MRGRGRRKEPFLKRFFLLPLLLNKKTAAETFGAWQQFEF